MIPTRLNLLVIRSEEHSNTVRFYELLGLHFQEEQHGKGPVLPSLPFFLMLPFLLKKGWGFYSSLGLSTAVMIGLYYGMMVILNKSGIENGS